MSTTGGNTRRGFAAATSRRPRRCGSTTGQPPRSPTQVPPPYGSPAEQDRSVVDGHVAAPPQWRCVDADGPHGFLEGRVHGSRLLGALSLWPHASSSDQEASEEAAVRLFLDDLERRMVLPVCRNAEARQFFPDHTRRRLDDYLADAKKLVQLRWHPAVSYVWTHDRAATLLDTVMGCLQAEFCSLKIWKPDALTSYSGCTHASIWELARSSCSSGGGSASEASWPSSVGSTFSGGSSGDGAAGDSSFGDGYYYMAIGEERSVRSGQALSGMASYIDLRSVSALNEIAGVMIEAGYEHKLRGAFDRHCAQLVRYIEILDIDSIFGSHMEESEELLLKVWTFTMRTIISVLGKMRRQLNQNDFGAFSSLKEEYFSVIAKVSVMKLLNYASVICIQVDPSNHPSCRDSHAAVIKNDSSKMVNVVMMYQALGYVKLEILALFFGQTKGLILAEVERLTNGLSTVFLELLIKINGLLRSQHLVISNTGVHHVTRHIMDLMRLLCQQKNTVCLMLNGNLDKFNVTQLISSLEFLLQMSTRSLTLQGQQQVFLLNNMNFMLEQANNNTDLKLILGENWCSQHHVQVDQLLASYVEASWTPVMSSFKITRIPKILWPQQLFDKFTSRFEMTYNVQKTWKVTDPVIRQKLREVIVQKVIPLYRTYMERYSENKQKSARYSVELLEEQLLEMFEG